VKKRSIRITHYAINKGSNYGENLETRTISEMGDWRLEIDDGSLTYWFGGPKIDLRILSFWMDSRYNSVIIFDWITPVSGVSSGAHFKPTNTKFNSIFIPTTKYRVILNELKSV
ncbi:MAG: hypothetical protein KDJ65_36045, partial [Anaerolineae bacterium]|nr:hypothetical protein [Anaerolineae bacterium]